MNIYEATNKLVCGVVKEIIFKDRRASIRIFSGSLEKPLLCVSDGIAYSPDRAAKEGWGGNLFKSKSLQKKKKKKKKRTAGVSLQ